MKFLSAVITVLFATHFVSVVSGQESQAPPAEMEVLKKIGRGVAERFHVQSCRMDAQRNSCEGDEQGRADSKLTVTTGLGLAVHGREGNMT